MKQLRSDLPDVTRSNLRAFVATVTCDLSRLSSDCSTGEAKADLDRVKASWGELLSQLNLGEEPEYQECPSCKHISMRKATLCQYCWATLTPPAPLSPGESQEALIRTR